MFITTLPVSQDQVLARFIALPSFSTRDPTPPQSLGILERLGSRVRLVNQRAGHDLRR